MTDARRTHLILWLCEAESALSELRGQVVPGDEYGEWSIREIEAAISAAQDELEAAPMGLAA